MRSIGLRIVPLLLILWGVGALLSSTQAAFWRWSAGQMAQLEARVANAVAEAKTKGFPEQDITRWEQMRQQYATQREQYEQLAQAADAMRADAVPLNILALLGVVAGIGMFLLKPWARLLAIGQATASLIIIPLSVFYRGRVVMERHLSMIEPSRQVGIQLGIALAIAWSVFVLWFLNRSSVKEQFQAARRV